MTFEVPASKASVEQDQFSFTIPGKRGKFSVKKAKFLDVGQAEVLGDGTSVSAVLDLFGESGTAQGDAVRSLDIDQFMALVQAWADDSGVTLGEFPASAG